MNRQPRSFDLASIRSRLDRSHGAEYWRSLEEAAASPEFQEFVHREFPDHPFEWDAGTSRRKFLSIMGASLALAGLTACTRQPPEQILPYVQSPEEVVPGEPLYYATALTLSGIGEGVLVKSYMGRPIKVEGNPDHPASLGATSVTAQAAVLSLYDPDRSQTIVSGGIQKGWGSFETTLRAALNTQIGKRGSGLRILTETVISPALAWQLGEILRMFPEARWHQYEPAGAHSARAGSQIAFGRAVNTYYRLDQAKVILALDADFLACGPAATRYARDFAAGRRVRGSRTAMNRLYAVESTATTTGGKADHKLPLRYPEIEVFARGVLDAIRGATSSGPHANWIAAVARDLARNRGASAVIPGDQQSPAVHILAQTINEALGNIGRTVVHTAPLEARPVDQFASLRDLISDIRSGADDLLLILGGNPVYTAPADLDFAAAARRVKLKIHLSQYSDETSALCEWHIPETHELEAWSDTRAYDGTVTIMQPLIAPLFQGHSAHELLSRVTGAALPGYDIVRNYWKTQQPSGEFDDWWDRSVHDGLIAGSALPAIDVRPRAEAPAPGDIRTGLEIVFRPDPYIYDGRFANNGWLQELPKPLSKLTWDNAALVSPTLAERLGLENEDVIELRREGRGLRAPIWIQPGCPDNSITVHLGYGRIGGGRIAAGPGFNAYAIRTAAAPWAASNPELRKTGRRVRLASVQTHFNMEGRDLAQSASLGDYLANPSFAQKNSEEPPRELTLYPGNAAQRLSDPSWGMSIDLTACVNCNACVIACQAENNIPVVGKDQVLNHREMHWLRVDTYYHGSLDNPALIYQPVPCMHCENAPCELVCPVQATNHTEDGLNDMIYNRCVGTRYCSNNCPYKVRRFNFFLYADWSTPSLKLQRNPEVTVRSRGVMEKCTYCIQRIAAAKIDAGKEHRSIRDGEVRTACQQACPTEAIAFGNIADPNSRVSKMKAEKLNYAVLAGLNTRPRTTYLAGLRNPNPELA